MKKKITLIIIVSVIFVCLAVIGAVLISAENANKEGTVTEANALKLYAGMPMGEAFRILGPSGTDFVNVRYPIGICWKLEDGREICVHFDYPGDPTGEAFKAYVEEGIAAFKKPSSDGTVNFTQEEAVLIAKRISNGLRANTAYIQDPKEQKRTYYFTGWTDENPAVKAESEQAEKVEVDMTFDEVVELLGYPQRDVGGYARCGEWDLSDGRVFSARFALREDYELHVKECWFSK